MRKLVFLSLLLMASVSVVLSQNEFVNEVVVRPVYIPLGDDYDLESVFVSASGKRLLATAKTKKEYAIFEFVKADTGWQAPKLVLKSDVYLGGASYSYDANTVFYSAFVSKDRGTDIFAINRDGDGWSKPVPLSDSINTNADELDPSLSYDSKTLYFIRHTSDQDDQCGNIFYAFWDEEKSDWHSPYMIVPPINNGCARYPRIGRDGRTMIFSAKRGEDKNWKIYYAYRFYRGIWTVPEALDFNTDKAVSYCFTTDMSSREAFFLRGKDMGKKVKLAIAPIAEKFWPKGMLFITGRTTFSGNGLSGVVIDVINPTLNATMFEYYSNAEGYYDLLLTPDRPYLVDFHKRGFSHSFEYINAIPSSNILMHKEINASLFDKVQLKINVYDQNIFEPLVTDIVIKDPATGKEYDKYKIEMPEKGQYVTYLDIDKKYRFVVSKKYYKTDSFDLDFTRPVVYDKFEWNLELKPMAKKVLIKVVDAKSGKGVQTEVEVIDLKSNKKYRFKTQTDADGNVELYLREGGEYEVTVAPRGYTFYHATFELEENEEPEQMIAKVEPLEENVEVKLNNITFETNSAELKPDSYTELNRLVELLKKNPNIRVEISAHTDDVGSEAYNLKLSQRRAKSVVDYLVERGIDKNRLIAKGYGESKPLVPNDSEEHRAMNRRVEFKILKVE